MSTKFGAYCGKVLKVDLTDRTVTEYPFTDEERELFLGGKIPICGVAFPSAAGNKKSRKEKGGTPICRQRNRSCG